LDELVKVSGFAFIQALSCDEEKHNNLEKSFKAKHENGAGSQGYYVGTHLEDILDVDNCPSLDHSEAAAEDFVS
jgi:hypothetical protein